VGDTITTIYQEVWVLSLNESKIYQLPLSSGCGCDIWKLLAGHDMGADVIGYGLICF
jgi:hypothetical protein